MTTAELIKDRRKKAGFTQQQLAALIGVNRVTVTKYESGKILPPIDKLHDIAAALQCDIVELIPSLDSYEEADFEDRAKHAMYELQAHIKEIDRRYIDALIKPALELNNIGRITLLKAALSMAADPDYTETDIERITKLWNISNGK